MIIVYIVLAVLYMAVGARIERGRYALRKPNAHTIARLEYDLTTAIRKVNGITCKYTCDAERYPHRTKCSCGNQKTIARFKTQIPVLKKQLRKETSVVPNYGTLAFWPALLLDSYVRGGTAQSSRVDPDAIKAMEAEFGIPPMKEIA